MMLFTVRFTSIVVLTINSNPFIITRNVGGFAIKSHFLINIFQKSKSEIYFYNDQYARLGRREKGMDLNVIDPKTRNPMPKTPEPDADENDIRALLERVVTGQDRLHTRLTKLEQKPPAHKPYKTPTHPHTFASTSYARTHNQSQTCTTKTHIQAH